MSKAMRWSEANHAEWKAKEAAREAANEPPRLKLTRPVEPEASVKPAVLKALLMHRRVAWAARFNTGAGKFLYPDGSTSQFVRFGFPGLADILGQLVTGQFLAVETKTAATMPTADQKAFLERVQRHGGVAFVARGVSDVLRELGPA